MHFCSASFSICLHHPSNAVISGCCGLIKTTQASVHILSNTTSPPTHSFTRTLLICAEKEKCYSSRERSTKYECGYGRCAQEATHMSSTWCTQTNRPKSGQALFAARGCQTIAVRRGALGECHCSVVHMVDNIARTEGLELPRWLSIRTAVKL